MRYLLLVAFLFEVAPAAVFVATSAAVVAVLEFSALFAVSTAFAIVLLAIGFYRRCIGESKLPVGNRGQLTLDSIVVHGFFMPVVVSQLHVVSDGIGET